VLELEAKAGVSGCALHIGYFSGAVEETMVKKVEKAVVRGKGPVDLQ
jgi:hypothetical protein